MYSKIHIMFSDLNSKGHNAVSILVFLTIGIRFTLAACSVTPKHKHLSKLKLLS